MLSRRRAALGLPVVVALALVAAAPAAAPPVRIAITFVHQRHPATISILTSARPRIVGRVRAASDGHGVAGVRVAVLERFPGRAPTVGATRVSRRHGLFSALLPRGGARVVGVVGGGAASNLLRTVTATAVSLAAAPTRVRAHAVVAFAGNVAAVTARVIVALQVRTAHGYQTFEIVRTRAGGAFHAVVIAQNGFDSPTGTPFGRSQSNTVTVDVL